MNCIVSALELTLGKPVSLISNRNISIRHHETIAELLMALFFAPVFYGEWNQNMFYRQETWGYFKVTTEPAF